jgi:hypothetical protein
MDSSISIKRFATLVDLIENRKQLIISISCPPVFATTAVAIAKKFI